MQVPITEKRIQDADQLAHAAFKRMNLGAKQQTRSQQAVKMEAQRQLQMEERMAAAASIQNSHSNAANTVGGRIERSFEHPPAVSGVYFSCELLGDDVVLPKKEVGTVF